MVTAGQLAGPSTVPVLVSVVWYAQTRVGPNLTNPAAPHEASKPCGSTGWSISFIVTVRLGWAAASTRGTDPAGPNTGRLVTNFGKQFPSNFVCGKRGLGVGPGLGFGSGPKLLKLLQPIRQCTGPIPCRAVAGCR